MMTAGEKIPGASRVPKGQTFDMRADSFTLPDGLQAKPLEISLCWTDFSDLYATSKIERIGTWSEIVNDTLKPKLYRKKSEMPLRKFAKFGDLRTKEHSFRHDKNIGDISAIEIDYDAGLIGFDETADRLAQAGIEAVIHTTARHAPDAHRYRILAPLSRPRPKSEHRYLTGQLNAAIGGIGAPESFTKSQSYYVGALHAMPRDARHISGTPLDNGPDLFLDAVYPTGDAPERIYADDTDELPENVTDETMRHLTSAVRALAQYRAHDYLDWLPVLQHLKHLAWCGRYEEAENLAREFSQRDDKFKETIFQKKWIKDLHPSHGHYKTLFDLATTDGWINPRKATQDNLVDGGMVDMTDSGNVNALFEITAGDMRYVYGANAWMHWDGRTWSIDATGGHAKEATLRCAEMYGDREKGIREKAEAATTAEDRKRYLKLADSMKAWKNYCRSRRGIDAVLSLAARDHRFVIHQDSLDKNRFLLGVGNGAVDLRTGDLRPSSRDEYITKRSPYDYFKDAQAPRFLKFADEICHEPIEDEKQDGPVLYRERPDQVRYLQKALGYGITGSVAEQKMFIASGPGANGKSVLFDILETILGPYAVRIPPEALMSSSRDGDAERPTPFARSVAGARLVVTSEAKEGQKLNAALVKRQTGDAKLTARGMRENAFTFDVTHKLWLLTNHHPELDHSDDAIRSRLHIVPFDRVWNRPGSPIRNHRLTEGDKNLMDTLRSEAEGILTWLVDGACRYVAEGLEPPPAVLETTSEYLKEQDPLGRWLADLALCDPKAGNGASDLFDDFLHVCRSFGIERPTPNNPTAFGKALAARNIPRVRTSAGMIYGLKHKEHELF